MRTAQSADSTTYLSVGNSVNAYDGSILASSGPYIIESIEEKVEGLKGHFKWLRLEGVKEAQPSGDFYLDQE